MIEEIWVAFTSGAFVGVFIGMWVLFVVQWVAKKLGKYLNFDRCGDGF